MFPIKRTIALIVIGFLGLMDSSYLAAKYYSGTVPPCSLLKGCDIVTTSKYAAIGGVSVALLGAIYYLIILIFSIAFLDSKKYRLASFLSKFSIMGVLASAWFLYLQIFTIRALCLYCLFSAATSTAIFVLSRSIKAPGKRGNPQGALQEKPKVI